MGLGFDDGNIIFKSILSTSWEAINQSFYTKLAQTIDPIDSSITFYAEILASGKVRAFNDKDEEITDTDPLCQLLLNPNDNQNYKEFIKEWVYYHYSHGYNYVVPQSSSVGFEKRLESSAKLQLFNCDPDQIDFIDSFFSFFSKKDKKIKFNYKPYNFSSINYNDVIPYFDVRQNPEKPYKGISRLLSLQSQIQNYAYSLQGKENLIKRTGSQLISLDGKTDDLGLDVAIPADSFQEDGKTTTHKEKLEKQLAETSLGTNSKGIMFSTLPLKVQSLSLGLEKVGFDNLAIEDARQIYNKFNIPKEFQNLTSETAKFQNRQMAMIEVVQNTIEPLANSFIEKLITFFNHSNKVIIDFSHLPVFSDNEKTLIETKQLQYNLLISLFEKDLLSKDELTKKLKENEII
jgi:hypothetical protein